MIAPINLSEGAIAMISSGGAQVADMNPVLQVVDLRLVKAQNQDTANERYRILLSDGEFLQQGMLATQRNDLVRTEKLQKGSIIRVTQFLRNVIQTRVVIIILELDVILDKCDPIGTPRQFSLNLNGNSPSMVRPPPINLLEGAIAMISSGDAQVAGMNPVLQVVDLRLVNAQNQNTANERYRILLSDGEFLQQGMLAMQCNYLVRTEQLQKGSIIRVTQFVRNVIESRVVIIILELDVILDKCDPIGTPRQFSLNLNGNSPSMVRPHPIKLLEGAIAMISSGDAQVADMNPVLQVVDLRLVNAQNHNTANERYRILLSDGKYLQQGMLATQRNYLVRTEQLQKGSIIRVTQFVRNVFESRVIIILLELDVILDKCDPIGTPKQFPLHSNDMNNGPRADFEG